MFKITFLPFYQSVTIPLYLLSVILIYGVAYKIFAREGWVQVFKKTVVLGFICSLYPFLLDLEKIIHNDTPVTRAYLYYIIAFIALANILLAVWNAMLIRRHVFCKDKGRFPLNFINDRFFLPILSLLIYSIFFYFSINRITAALAWSAIYGTLIISAGYTDIEKVCVNSMNFLRRIFASPYIIIFLFLFTLLLRVSFFNHLISVTGPAKYIYASDDGDAYDEMGLAGAKDLSYFAKETPGTRFIWYSVFISIIYKIFGHNFYAVAYIQSLLGAAAVLCIYGMAYMLFKNRIIAFIAAMLLAIDQPMILFTTTLNTEALFIPFLVFAIFFLFLYKRTSSSRKAFLYLFLTGIFISLATIMRELTVVIPLFWAFWIVMRGRDYEKRPFLFRTRDFFIILIVMFSLILPITMKNYINTGKFHLLYKSGFQSWEVESRWGESIVPSNKLLINLGVHPFVDFKGAVLSIVRKPAEFSRIMLKIIPVRLRNLFLWPKYGYFDPIYLLNPYVISNEYAFLLIFYSILMLLFSFAAFVISKADGGLKFLVAIPVILYLLLHGALFLMHSVRYSAPMTPFLSIIVAYGLVRLFSVLSYEKR